jgi:23S rRNA C2498 (ribose-2'-O)-methylase RlmM
MWLNAMTADEGCTMVDARKLREYNHGLAEENARITARLDPENLADTLANVGLIDHASIDDAGGYDNEETLRKVSLLSCILSNKPDRGPV